MQTLKGYIAWKNFELLDKFNPAVRHDVTIVARGEFQTGARARTEERALDYHGRGGGHWYILILVKRHQQFLSDAHCHAPGYDLDLNFFVNQVYTGSSGGFPSQRRAHTQDRAWQEPKIRLALLHALSTKSCEVAS